MKEFKQMKIWLLWRKENKNGRVCLTHPLPHLSENRPYTAARARRQQGMRYIMSQHMHMQFARSTIKAPPVVCYIIV